MATSLKAFIEESNQISATKQAQQLHELRQAQAAEAAAKHGHRPLKGSNVQQQAPSSPVGKQAGGSLDKGKEVVKPVVDQSIDDVIEPSIEEALLRPLDPGTLPEDDPVRTLLASTLLAQHGELILSLGAHPTPQYLYHPDTLPSVDNNVPIPTFGTPLTDSYLASILARLLVAVNAVQAVMSELYLIPSVAPPETNAATYGHPMTGKGPYGEWLVRLTPQGVQEIMEVRVAVVGNVDAGKSTMLGVLTRGGLDDGRGKARVALFRHKHEIETGRTSSVGMEILGFSPQGEPVIPTGHGTAPDGTTITTAKREKLSWDEISRKAAKIMSFIDLAGHERYLKTTLFGLTGCQPDYVLMCVGGNAGLIGMSKEHLGVALALQVPVIIAVTKIDSTPAHVLETTIKQLVKVLKSPGCRKVPVFVETAEQAVSCARNLVAERLCPIFLVSNVTGHNLPMLRRFLNVLPSSQMGEKYIVDAPLELSVSDVFSVPFSGSVVSGVITSGKVNTGDAVLLGPDSTGQFIPTVVKSIERKRASVTSATAGQSVSFALKKIRRSQIRKGMVIVAKSENGLLPKAVRRFEGQVLILYHNTTIQPGYNAVLHVGAVRQTVRIVSIDSEKGILRTGDRARVIFEFVQGPEYIREGNRMLFREGKTKGLGVVTSVNVS